MTEHKLPYGLTLINDSGYLDSRGGEVYGFTSDGEEAMATNVVNLDALISREDLAVTGDATAIARTDTLRVSDFESGSFFYRSLRKPDFQRETSNWSPQKICDFVKTFLDQELVPAIILWSAGANVFVIDGAHRLSALIAWVQDDYGDKLISRAFFENAIPAEQVKTADRTRSLVNKTIGSYADYKKAMEYPDKANPEILSRAKLLGSLALELQWVRAANGVLPKNWSRWYESL